MRTLAILGLGLLSAPVAAFAGGPMTPAAEAYVAPPMAMTPTRADGDWGGFYAGAQLGYGNITSNSAGLDGNGAIGGIHAGYRFDMGRAVVGGELDYNLADIELGQGLFDTNLDSVTRLKVMAGIDMGRALIYLTGGAAYADATLGGVSASDNGYFAGIGMDYQLTDQLNLGGELLGHRFENFDGTAVDLEAVTLQAKVAYRF